MFTRSHLEEMKRRYREMYVSPEEGTDELVDQYKKETPGQSCGIEEDTNKDEPGTQGDQAEYQRKRKEIAKKFGVESCSALKDEKERKACYAALDAAHVSDDEEEDEDDDPVGKNEEVEVNESLALQLKMAFGDAKIKIKDVKGGKLVIDKKDKKKVEDVISKQMKKPADAKRVLGSQIVFEEVEIDEKFAGWIAFYNKEKLEIKPKKGEIDSLNDAKQAAIKHFKVPKSKQGLLAIEPAHEEVELDEADAAYPPTIKNLKMIVKDKQNQVFMFPSGKARVDLFTASAMVQVYDALKPALKKTFEKMIADKGGFMKTQAFAMKMMK